MSIRKRGIVSKAISDRSGFRFPVSDMIREPGTGYLIHKSESDGRYNLVDHPLNHINKFIRDYSDPKPNKDVRKEPIEFKEVVSQLTPYWNWKPYLDKEFTDSIVFDLDVTMGESFDVNEDKQWLNLVENPNDGSSKESYNFTPNDLSGRFIGEPDYKSSYWLCDNIFEFYISSNTEFIKNLHKTTKGNSWTICVAFKTSKTVRIGGLLGTAITTGDTGITLWGDSGGALKFDQFANNGRSIYTVTEDLQTEKDYLLILTFNQDNNLVSSALNSSVINNTNIANFNIDTSTDPTSLLYIAAKGSGNDSLDDGVRLYSVSMFNKDLNSEEIKTLYELMQDRHGRKYV